MKNYLSCIQKDLKLFGRSKFSAFVAVVVPLLLVLLISSVFSSGQLQGVKVAVYSSSYNDLTNSILSTFEKQSFTVSKQESQEKCISSVQDGKDQICVVFPAALSNEGNTDSVVFHVDSSRINIAYILIDEIKTQISTKSSELSLDMINDLIIKINQAKIQLENDKSLVASLSKDSNAIKNKASEITSSVPSTGSVSSSLSSSNETLNDIQTLVNSLNDSDSNVVRLKQNIVSFQQDLQSIISTTQNLENSLSSISQNVSSLKDSSLNLKNKLDLLNQDLENITTNLNSLRVTEAEKIASPIKTEIKSVIDESSNWDYIFPTLLALLILFGSVVLSSVLTLKEKQTKAYFRNFITPTSDLTFVLATYTSTLIILFVQLTVLFSGLAVIAEIPILNIVGNVSLIILASATTFIFLGICVGNMFRSEEAVILISFSIVFVLMFFSNTIVPIETILGNYQQIAIYNPLVVTASMFSRTLFFDAPLSDLTMDFLVLAATLVVFFTLALISRKMTKRVY